MKLRVYVETTIVSVLAALPTSERLKAVRQQATKRWWSARRNDFSLYTSQLVIEEAKLGDAAPAIRRLGLLEGISIVDVTYQVSRLARQLLARRAMPQKASVDALHVALAAVHGLDYLLTWNCRHIANAELWPGIDRVCRESGVRPPFICTPDELMGA